MKLQLAFIFFIIYVLGSYAQDIDSLLNVVSRYKLKDSIQCERYNILIEDENDASIWIKYNLIMGSIATEKLKSTISNQEKKVYFKYLGLHYNNVGLFYRDNKTQSISLYEKAVAYYKKANDVNGMALTLQNIGTIYDTFGEPQKALFYYNQVIQIYEKSKNLKGLANIYADFGRFYGEYGAYNKAFIFYSKSMKISDSIDDKPSKMRAIKFQIIALNRQKEYGKMLEYLSILEKYFIKTKNDIALGEVYNNYTYVYNELKTIDKMNVYLNKTIELAKKIKSSKLLANAYGHYASYYLDKNDFDNAIKYSSLDLELTKTNRPQPQYTICLIKHSSILNLKKQYKSALDLGLEGFTNAKSINNLEVLQSAAKNLKQIYKNLNNKSLAFKYAEEEIAAKDTLNAINTKNSAINSLFKYETEKKEAQITALAKDKKIAKLESQRQKTGLLLLAIAILSILVSGYLLFKRYKTNKQNEILRVQLLESSKTLEAEKKASESELKALKSQMNPHFIFNALNGIQEQFMYGDKVIANEQMGNFTYLTRQILEVSGKKEILLATEIDILSKYLELEKMRFKTDFEYAITTNETIDEDYHEIPPMIIQPFVENAMKHGLLHKTGDKKITVNFDLSPNEDFLICTISDNGIGRKASAEIKEKSAIKHESFSTNSIEERLKLLDDNNQNNLIIYEDILDNDNNVTGTKVIVKISILS